MEQTNSFLQAITQSNSFKLIHESKKSLQAKKQIMFDSKCEDDQDKTTSQKGDQIYQKLKGQNVKRSNSDIWNAILHSFKQQFIVCFILVQIQGLSKITLCLLAKFLFYNFQDGNVNLNYLYATLIALNYLLYAVVSQNGWRLIEKLSIQIKGAITYALYKKILTLTKYSSEKTLGTITNAITEFHDILQNRSKYIFSSFASPLIIIGLTVLLVIQAGWYSLVGVGILLVCEFIHYHFENYNSNFLQKVLKHKDQRIQLLHRAISAFTYVKMQIWEEMILEKILGIRKKEMKEYLKYGGGVSLQIALSQGVSTACILIILKLTVLYSTQMTALAVILTVLFMIQLKLVVLQLAYGINCFYQLQGVISKIKSIFEIQSERMIKLNQSEDGLDLNQMLRNSNSQKCNKQKIIRLSNVSLYLSDSLSNQTEILSQVNLNIYKGDFIGIYGPIGSGKSTLLNFLASQIPYYSGQFSIEGSLTLASQEPVIFSGTIRQNILFGKQMEEFHYKKVIEWSCLKNDLDLLQEKDLTKICEGSSNLSGGQKTRIALARCFYANKDILLLDDPLSSLDAVVAKEVVKNLKKLHSFGKTIVLVTHLTSYLSDVEQVYVIGGKKVRQNKINSNVNQSKDYQNSQASSKMVKIDQSKPRRKSSFVIEEMDKMTQNNPTIPPNETSMKVSQNSNYQGFWLTLTKFIFLNPWNKLMFPLTILLYLLSEALYIFFMLLLSQFDKVLKGQPTTVGNQSNFWTVLSILPGVIFILQILRIFFLNVCIQLSNKTLHKNGLRNFFRLDPVRAQQFGLKQVVSRFSTDLGLLDTGLLYEVGIQFICIILISTQCVFISISNPLLLLFLVVLFIMFYVWNKYCHEIVIAAKNLDLELKSPLVGTFTETVLGLTQINVEKSQDFMINKFKKTLNKSLNAAFGFRRMYRVYCSYGVYFSSLLVGACYYLLVGTLSIEEIFKLTLAASLLLQINQVNEVLFSNFIKISSIFSSVQRLLVFNKLLQQQQSKTEKEQQIIQNKVFESYPSLQNFQTLLQNKDNMQKNQRGNKNYEISLIPSLILQQSKEIKQSIQSEKIILNIQKQTETKLANDPRIVLSFEKIHLKYEKSKPAVLKNITFNIRRGQKVGLIGRTGAGKSSMLQLIYRLVDPEDKSVYMIEGQDALSMDVNALRKKFTCVPQQPFLFSDSLRKNMDPFDEHPDEKIVESLSAVNMWPRLQKMHIHLDSEIRGVLDVFSVGQKQLICLARAILQSRQFLILDEFTSNIDLQTDQFIQSLIRRVFANATIIAVAHRLQTVADFDQIVVFSKGQIKQIGPPRQLYESQGQFYSMVESMETNKHKIIEKIYCVQV